MFRNLTIAENLKLAVEFLRGRSGVGPAQEAEVLAMFPEIARQPKVLAGNLSGGQRQMLAFACALVSNPEVLLLDEPTAGLSPKFVEETMQAVLRVREAGVTVLLVEQNVAAALRFADEVMVLVAGRKSCHVAPSVLSGADLTATAVCSVSATPPSILVVINQSSRSHDLIEQGGSFAVNILSAEQAALAHHFAAKSDDPLQEVDHRSGVTGVPVIEGCVAQLECMVETKVAAGTHSIFIGRVVAVEETDRMPLMYRNGKVLWLERALGG